MARYKYTQESGTDFKVNNSDKCDGLEDTNEVRQIVDDLGDLLGHSKFNDLYPEDGTAGGDIDARRVTTKTGEATLTIGEAGLVLVSAAAGYTLTLPTAVGIEGRVFIFVKTDDNSNIITIDGNASETINGSLTYTGLNYQWSYVAIESDDSDWIILYQSILGIQAQDLNMGTHKIVSVVDPVDAQDAATKAYADSIAPKIHSAVGSTDIDTSSTGYADMTDMSITETFPAGKVLIGFCAHLKLDVAADGWYAIIVDDVIKFVGQVNYNRGQGNLCWVETLTAAEHTIKIQWKTESAERPIYQIGASLKRILTILECQ